MSEVNTNMTAPKNKEAHNNLLHIPGVDIEKIREKVKIIVESADKDKLTVKGLRKMLENWLDMDLSEHKDTIRTIIMEAF